nr:immunoglobulin heavy chain junction region [Mus musculus]
CARSLPHYFDYW